MWDCFGAAAVCIFVETCLKVCYFYDFVQVRMTREIFSELSFDHDRRYHFDR
jgi:hypothetical protein